MASALAEAVVKHADQLLEKRGNLLMLWQDIAENFYPQRADFTTVRNTGDEMARNLMTSFPVLAHRDLSNALPAMLRPSSKDWFGMRTNRPDQESTTAKQWLQWMAKLMKNAMYDTKSMFVRATKEGDGDFAAFGQTVLSVEMSRSGAHLLYRCWHLRDVAWSEDAEGRVSTITRRWKPTALDMQATFAPDKLDNKVREALKHEPYKEFDTLHLVLPTEQYRELPGAEKAPRTPWVSVWVDKSNMSILEMAGSWTRVYVVPRWQTVSGSQYAHSPAAVAALPDTRLLQAMTETILSAGEKAVDPPMIAVQEAIRGDVAVYPGGITWVDAMYDERLGEVLRQLNPEKQALSFGLDYVQDLRGQMANAWYLSKLNLPPVDTQTMTAYEVGQRVQEFIRNTLPLFEPMEVDYNGGLCEATFELLMRNSPEIRASVPRELAGADVQFTFESPLREAADKIKVGQFAEAQQIIATAMQLNPGAANVLDGDAAVRDVLEAVVPAKWLRTPDAAKELSRQQAEQQQAAAALALMQGGADVAKTLGQSGLAPAAAQ